MGDILIIACVFLGEIALWLDLGSRLFGSYARTPMGLAARIGLIVVLLLALASPLVWLWIDPISNAARATSYASGGLGAVAFVHFLFPYRWGIRRASGVATRSTQPIATGIVLADYTLELPELPQPADGLTIVLCSDLHCNTQRHLQLFRDAVGRLEASQPDLVFLLGDFGERLALLPEVVDAAARLRGRLGTFCVLGNHDYEGGRQAVLTDLFREQSVCVLRDEFHDLPEVGIVLLGLAYPWSRNPTLPERREGYVLALTHSPDNLPYLDRLGVALAFAGHTHGGKLRIPAIGAILVPSKLGRFLDHGWVRRGRTLLYVSRGIGYFPGRLGNVGEICRITMRKTSQGTHSGGVRPLAATCAGDRSRSR